MESYRFSKLFLLLLVCLIILSLYYRTQNYEMKSIVSLSLSSSSPLLFSSSSVLVSLDKDIHRKLDDSIPSTLYNFDKVKKAGEKLINLIYNRYELYDEPGSQFFLTANNYGNLQWDILKYKYAIKTLQGNSSFLMIFGGSSVTAGHDNYFNQSYPMIFKKRMLELFQGLGIDLQVHNIAQGANNCIPYTFCYESMGGLDPDFVGWEQSYNCGRDEAIFELVGRIAGFSKNKALTYYSASGAWLPECPASKDDPPFCSESWTPDQATLFVGENSTVNSNSSKLPFITLDQSFLEKYKKITNDYYRSRPTASRFIGWADILKDDSYHAVAPHGFNVWEPNPMCRYTKDGKTATNCNGIDAVQGCKMRFMTAEAAKFGSDGGGGARWHPSRAFHMLRGEALAWLYTLPLLDSIYMLETDLSTNSKESLIQKYSDILEELHPSKMPGPKKCGNYICKYRPICYTDFKPHFPTNMTLSELIVGKHNWTLEDNEYGDWSLHYGYLDIKPLYVAQGADHSELSVRIHINHVKQVAICGQVKESLLHTHVYLDANVTLPSNVTDYVPSNNRTLLTSKKYIGGECKYLLELPQGDHVISIKTKGRNEKHKHGLSHVIMWP